MNLQKNDQNICYIEGWLTVAVLFYFCSYFILLYLIFFFFGGLQCLYEATVHCTGLYIPIAIGLEIPASYNFYHKKPSKKKNLVELLRDKGGTANL